MPSDITKALRRRRQRELAAGRPIIKAAMEAWKAVIEKRATAIVDAIGSGTVGVFSEPTRH